MARYAIGVDFGTESARAVLVDVARGDVVASIDATYASGVIDQRLPASGAALPHDWALQDPRDWLDALRATVTRVLQTSGVAPAAVVGLGLDFTACTVLPTTADGTPLCLLDEFHTDPHAWPKLWKHHAAQPEADRVNELAAARGERWLARYGGKVSSEWLLPKAFQILDEAPATYHAAAQIIEGGDWLTWQLTGRCTRNRCAAGFKAIWHPLDGFPNEAFLAGLHPELTTLYREKVTGPLVRPGERVGGLTPYWADALGLPHGLPVAAALIDAHAGVLGAGATRPGTMYLAMGTSTCHMVLDEREVLVEGVAGVVQDGIVPGLVAYEAGQSAVGDIFAWVVTQAVPASYHEEAARRGLSIHSLLSEKASAQRPGQSGLLALDWWGGNRSPLMDASLSGIVLGYTLATRPEDVYRAVIEATAFGTRLIIATFNDHGVPIRSLVAGGGLTRNPFLMQLYADITGYEIAVAGSDQASALGAAILGAAAADREAGGYASLNDAVHRMAPPPATVYHPIPEHRAPYDRLYESYRLLHHEFGRDENQRVMRLLHQLRSGSSAEVAYPAGGPPADYSSH